MNTPDKFKVGDIVCIVTIDTSFGSQADHAELERFKGKPVMIESITPLRSGTKYYNLKALDLSVLESEIVPYKTTKVKKIERL